MKKKKFLDVVVDTMSAIFVPTLPVITAAGVLRALILLLAAVHVLPEESSTYYVLSFIADAGFYFLPVILAHSASKHFGGSPYLACFLCLALFHPDFTGAVESGKVLTFLSLPVRMNSYQAAVISGVLTGWWEATVEKFIKKWMPELISFFAVPLLTTLIAMPLILLVFGPAGLWIGDVLCQGMDFIYTKIGWPAIALLAALTPMIVAAGFGLCFLPLSLGALAATGVDPFSRPAFLAANIAMAGAAFAVFVKSKIRTNKSLGLQTSVIALMGITEPSIYGVLIPLKRPYIASMLAAAIGGAFAGLTHVKSVAYASPSLITLPIFLSDTFVYAVLTVVLTFGVSFLLTWFIGFEDKILHGSGDGTKS